MYRESGENFTGTVNKSDEKHKYFAGPLNINRAEKQATTAMGASLILRKNDFEALDLLSSNEGKYLTFQQLYEASWGTCETTDSLDYAFAALNNLIVQINTTGENFMWIEKDNGSGYRFKTRWADTWIEDSDMNVYDPHKVMAFSVTPSASASTMPLRLKGKQKNRRLKLKPIMIGAGAVAAVLILVFVLLYTTGRITPDQTDPIYVEMEDPDAPLASPPLED